MIIAFEGTDKAGKHTQSRKFCAYLKHRAITTALFDFPTANTPTGDAIDAYMRGAANTGDRPRSFPPRIMPCLAATDLWSAADAIRPAVDTHDVVVLNRSPASNVAYGVAAGLPAEWLRNLTAGHPAAGLWDHQLTVLLDIPIAESFARVSENRDVFESDPNFQRRARAAYLAEARRNRSRNHRHDHVWLVVRGNRPAEDVHRTVCKQVMNVMHQDLLIRYAHCIQRDRCHSSEDGKLDVRHSVNG